jgi:hypothetical protein
MALLEKTGLYGTHFSLLGPTGQLTQKQDDPIKNGTSDHPSIKVIFTHTNTCGSATLDVIFCSKVHPFRRIGLFHGLLHADTHTHTKKIPCPCKHVPVNLQSLKVKDLLLILNTTA